MRNVIGFTHRASGAGPLARPIASARRGHESLRKTDCLLPHDEPGAPTGLLMSLMAPNLLSPRSA
jgi:hypothetical protein